MLMTQHALEPWLAKYHVTMSFMWATKNAQKATEGVQVLPGSPESAPLLEFYSSKHFRPWVPVACPVWLWPPLYSDKALDIFLICEATTSQTPVDDHKLTLHVNVSYVCAFTERWGVAFSLIHLFIKFPCILLILHWNSLAKHFS